MVQWCTTVLVILGDGGAPQVVILPTCVMSRSGFKSKSFIGTKAMRAARAAKASQSARAARARAGRSLPPSLFAALSTGATELKSVDTEGITLPLGSSAGDFVVLNIPVEGASFFNRIGRRIRMKSLHLRGGLFTSGSNAAPVGEQLARLMVVYDRQPNGALPATADLLTSYSSSGSTSSTVFDGINMNNRDRFLVLADMQVILPAAGINGATAGSTVLQAADPNLNAGAANQGQLNINRFIKLQGLEAHFKATAGAIGDIATGSLFLFGFSSGDANASPAWQFEGTARLKFYD